MPKLTKKVAARVEKAQATTGDFEPITPGKYIATLSGVEAKTTNAGNPMWVAEFIDITSLRGEVQPGRQWYNLNLPIEGPMPADYVPKASRKSPEEAWAAYQAMSDSRVKGFFEAFGFSVDSDTDELEGEKALITIGIRTIQQGDRKGEKVNSVNSIKAVPGDLDLEALGGDEDDDEDDF
jgi:hypothetical protein